VEGAGGGITVIPESEALRAADKNGKIQLFKEKLLTFSIYQCSPFCLLIHIFAVKNIIR
jgi:hypothetical protein